MDIRIAAITETDPTYIADMISYFGLEVVKPGFVRAPLEIIKRTHGLEVVETADSWIESNADVVAYVARNQQNPFYQSLQLAINRYGRLTDKQMAYVIRSMEADAVKKAEPKSFTLKAGDVVRVGRTFAKRLAQNMGLASPVFNMEIVEIQKETEKAWYVSVRGSGIQNGYCGCCGLLLSDPISIKNNIGPICADRLGVDRSDSMLMREIVRIKLEKIATSGFIWLPKSVVKDRYEN